MTSSQQLILNLLVTATLLPLVSSLLIIFLGKRVLGHASGWFATGAIVVAFLCSVWALMTWMGDPHAATIVWNVPWIPLGSGSLFGGSAGAAGDSGGWLYVGALIDSLTVAVMAMVCGIALLVHLYSVGYMHGDPRFERFFAYLSLFTFSMLGIVMSQSLLMIFVFWELVGLTSYLLIGFWFEKKGPQLACRKAFVMNRIGDIGFLIGFGIVFYQLGGRVLLPAAQGAVVDGHPLQSMLGLLSMPTAQGGLGIDIMHPPVWLTVAGIGLFFGAIGKSAQFPLHTWLPDAMEGPTPVSSIVHSATMVAAGVYLTARLYPILTPQAHLFVAVIGLITLVIAALMAVVMTDIKRVLAYSTLSQLGYMILGLGAGAYAFALFHLITHAFFKCCLFQCAGSVIHGAHHEQDMRQYGGLGKKMPVTAAAYGLSTLAIAGASIPFLPLGVSGYYSKDGIIAGCAMYAHAMHEAGFLAAPLFYWGPLIVAYITCFYMARSFTLTFLGKPRNEHLFDHAHEAPWTMLVPQVALALMAFLAVPMVLPFFDLIAASTPKVSYVLPPAVATNYQQAEDAMEHGFHAAHSGLLLGFAWILAVGLGVAMYLPGMKYSSRIASLPVVSTFYIWIKNKYYFDDLYDTLAVGFVKFIAIVVGAFDKYIVDGLVNLAAYLGRGSAWCVGLFDHHVIDGATNGLALIAHGIGNTLRVTQDGRVRGYVLLMFTAAVLIGLVVVGVVVAAG